MLMLPRRLARGLGIGDFEQDVGVAGLVEPAPADEVFAAQFASGHLRQARRGLPPEPGGGIGTGAQLIERIAALCRMADVDGAERHTPALFSATLDAARGWFRHGLYSSGGGCERRVPADLEEFARPRRVLAGDGSGAFADFDN